MIKLKDILLEAKQVGIIYHYTSYSRAIDIIKSGKLKSDEGGPLGKLDDPFYAISFTRDKNFHKESRFLTQVGSNIPCRFTFDGNKMSSEFSIKPYAQKGFEKGSLTKAGKQNFEAEERIVSKKKFDVLLSKYVTSFDIIIEYKDQKKWNNDKLYYLDMKDCIKLCKENNIKINTIDGNGDPVPPKEVKSFFQKVLSKLKLNEIGDGSSKAFPWQYHEEHPAADSQDFGYTFKTDKGDYYVSFVHAGTNEWDLAFGPLGSSSSFNISQSANYGVVTGIGAFRVMATVVEIVKDFLDSTFDMHINDKDLYGEMEHALEPKKISFNTTKEKGRSEKEDSRRSNLYKAYIQKQVPGARVERQPSGAQGDAYVIHLP
jgi:hypothetical protein